MDLALLSGLFLPLIGFIILMASSSTIGRKAAGFIACGSVGLSFLLFAYLFAQFSEPIRATLYRWIPVPGFNTDFTLHLDTLSLLMTLVVTGVGFLIHVYSNGYMEEDEDYARYFACLNFFVFSMLLLVLAGNLLLLFVGWEGVGLASYLLIGYYYTRSAAAQAATKAFVVNRIGDWGFLLGILLTFYLFGTSDIPIVNSQVGSFAIGAPIITALALLYFCGAVGKSAQIPLQVWLPDAMEGPTPVSALIHAATMVTAGVYLVVRMHPVFLQSPLAMQVVGLTGAVTSLYAALSAVGQMDLKRVLAYSTVSQLGLMFIACGVGAFYAAMFHLTMHAFVKGLLFLSAGNVVHMMHGATDMEKMGDLARKFPKTHILFLIGALALAGIPPLAAFFSKDLILEEADLGFKLLFYLGLAASALTGFYLIRAYCIAFLGKSRAEGKIVRLIHEAPQVMLIPVSILALLSIVGGLIGFSPHSAAPLEQFLEKSGVTLTGGKVSTGFHFSSAMLISIVGAFLGVIAAALLYTRYKDRLGHTLGVLKKSFYFDEIYEWLFVGPLKTLSRFVANILEPHVFDGMIRDLTRGAQNLAGFFQGVQSGQIRSYVAWMVAGSVLLIAYFLRGLYA
jgi:NADH-quinone oxidoreductase subunit L